ncbi:MAG: O-antigen ligase family protein [Actinomycetota bacterium]|nr:O-antigen ligase family protein [Actinomycetota bacterium]
MQRLRVSGTNLAFTAGGGVIVLMAAFASVKVGAQVGAGAVVVAAVFLGTMLAYMYRPHVAVAGTILLFTFVPALKVFVNPQVGAVKDLVCLAAIFAALLLYAFERRRGDWQIGMFVLLLMGLYVIDAGGSHNTAWAQGVRLIGEPLLLLLVGLLLPDPQRNLRYAVNVLIGAACVVALYGLLQQVLGPQRLVSLGYAYGAQVRTIGASLRSFGTFDDPFSFAAFLLLAIGAVLFWLRRGPIAWATGLLLLAGLAASFVRTGALVLVGFGALLLIRSGRTRPAIFLLVSTAVIAALTLVHAGGSQSQAFAVFTRNGGSQVVTRPVPGAEAVILNGRVSAWKTALGNKPSEWLLGRGVGKVGTAAERAAYTLAPASTNSTTSTATTTKAQAVDSGYLATIADVGVAGLAVLVAVLWRCGLLNMRQARRGSRPGWFGVALLTAMLLDALTRASFTGFPTADLGTLLLGVCVAAGAEKRAGAATPRR